MEHDRLYYTASLHPVVSDQEYDTLALRHAEDCKEYPHLLRKLQHEEKNTRYGDATTRFGGRVGMLMPPITSLSTNDGTTNTTVGDDNNTTNNIPHRLTHFFPMLSLDNVFDRYQVTAWLEKFQRILQPDDKESALNLVLEPKMDVLSLSLRYELRRDDDDNDAISPYYQLQ